MNLIEKAIENLVPSKPIFSIKLRDHYDGGHIAEINKTSNPHKGNSDTPVEKLVAKHFSETWDKNKYIISGDAITTACRSEIKGNIVRFLEKNMKQKYPMETKLGIFYRDRVFNTSIPAFDNALISTYNFFVEKGDSENTMKLLEFLFIKHKGDFPEEPKRQKRRRRRR